MPTSACCSAIVSGVAMGQSTSSRITPPSTDTGNVSTGTYAGRFTGLPVRSSNTEPWRGHSTVQDSASISPSRRLPSSCEQRSSMASSSPLQLKMPISRSSHSTSRCSPGGSSSRGQMSITGLIAGPSPTAGVGLESLAAGGGTPSPARARDRRPRAGRAHGRLDRRAARPLSAGRLVRFRRMEDVYAHLLGAYERAAPTYERTAFAHHAPFGEQLAHRVLLGPGGRVLDVGCGAGGALLPAARRVGPTGAAVGVDLAPGMVERTRAAADEAGLEQVRAEVMDGAALEGFEDGRFDAVLAAFSLSAIPDAQAALAEWRRVLAPTGTLGVAVWENLVDNRWLWEGELIGQFALEVPQELLQTVGAMTGRFAETEK